MLIKSVFVTLSLILGAGPLLAAPPSSQKWLISADKGGGSVEFDAIGRPSALKIHGKGPAPKGQLTIEGVVVSGDLSFDLDALDTGIKMRNEHMKQKYLETPKYSQATLTITQLTLPEALKGTSGRVEKMPFDGVLSLHGVKKPVSGVASVQREDSQLKVTANFGLKTNDFGISTPSFAGITMAEDVQVAVDLQAPLSPIYK